MAATGNGKTKPISREDVQRKLIEGKIEKEQADLERFQARTNEQLQAFMAQANAEIAARVGRIQAYRELIGIAPETDTTVAEPAPSGNALEGVQEGPGRTEGADQVVQAPLAA